LDYHFGKISWIGLFGHFNSGKSGKLRKVKVGRMLGPRIGILGEEAFKNPGDKRRVDWILERRLLLKGIGQIVIKRGKP